ncbi:AAA family ATPase [Catenulispora sp. NL8]|uniref:AAA family ATPase n=1 Tax=Catenulispora pinistramenti TaxID=2705254 RepID=A0ABS5KQ68_9ACTN|nr:LuxR C-terminal-related transcriptional regulator [Catenulispora pinistramenti]MBS2548180.1 AAA family ATPase [Catenulispora pinistramenti]
MGGIEALVGRGRELAAFDALLRHLHQTRTGAAVWVEGDAGMGKSAVATALATLATRSGLPVRIKSLGSDEVPLAALAELSGCRLGQFGSVAEAVDRLGAAMAAVCAEGPVVLVADDLHLAEESSLLAWSQLSKMARRLPVLLVSTCSLRPYRERLSQLRESVHDHGGEILSLRPLQDAELVTLAEHHLGRAPGPRLVRYLKALQGNPGAAVGMLSGLDFLGLLSRTGKRVELSGSAADSAAILAAHACRGLSAAERAVVREAALAPARFDAADVAHAGGLALPTVAAALSSATHLGILRTEGDRLVFRHEVLRDACVRALSAPQRRTSHQAAVARLLADGARPLTIAHHVRAAGELSPDAVEWRAGLTESTLLDDPALFSGVLHMAPADPRSAITDYWQGDYEAVVRTATEWDGDSRVEDDKLTRLAIRALIRTERPDDALVLSAGSGDPHIRAWRALALVAAGATAAARADIEEIAVDQGDDSAVAALAHALVRTGRGVRVQPDIVAVRDALADTAEGRELRALLHCDLLELLPQIGPPDAVPGVLGETPAILAVADSGLLDRIQAAAGWAAYAIGQWDAASALDPRVAATVAARRAQRPSQRAVHTALRTHWEPLAIQAETDGHLEEALDLRRRALAEALGRPPSRLYGAEHVVRLCRATGGDADSIVEDCQRVADDELLPVQIAMAALVRAVVERDAAGLTAAASRLSEHGAIAQQAFALEEAAVCLAEAGDRRAAGRALQQAVQVYACVGAAWDVARADARLQQHRIRRRTPADQPASGWAALTPAEFRVVRLVARGLSNRAIAEELFLSQNTVQTHLARIRDKLGLRSRLDIARAAGFRADAGRDPVKPRGGSEPSA